MVETPQDVKVGALIIQEFLKIKEIGFFSDFCHLSGGPTLFNKTYNLGRTDPAVAETNIGKKPSHSAADTFHIFNSLAKNM